MLQIFHIKKNTALLAELPQIVRTVQKSTPVVEKIKFKQRTDIAFRVVSVWFLTEYVRCCKSICIHL